MRSFVYLDNNVFPVPWVPGTGVTLKIHSIDCIKWQNVKKNHFVSITSHFLKLKKDLVPCHCPSLKVPFGLNNTVFRLNTGCHLNLILLWRKCAAVIHLYIVSDYSTEALMQFHELNSTPHCLCHDVSVCSLTTNLMSQRTDSCACLGLRISTLKMT